MKQLALALLLVAGCDAARGSAAADLAMPSTAPDLAAASSCPASAPLSQPPVACAGSVQCNYGSESCCGMTYASVVCRCQQGSFSCFYTDACLIPGCPDAGP